MKHNKKIKPFVFLLLLFSLVFSNLSIAQIVINEVCSYNGSVIEDEDEDEPDWFELYNIGISAVSLSGYSIADNNSPKWFFPDTSLAAGNYLLVFASGKDRKDSALHTSFQLSKDADMISLFNPTGAITDQVTFGKLHLDNSMGRFPDGNDSSFVIFNTPTPGASNNASEAYSAYSETPIFSIDGGFYQGSPTLSIAVNNPMAIIHYTTNGSVPTDTSAIYAAPIHLDTTSIIRARSFSNNPNMLPSEIISNTYILNYQPKLPVISISTNPANLWDWNTGIYVLGPNADTAYPYHGANFWQDWEVPAHIEFFETNRTLAFEQDAGLSINGGSVSRTRPQQSFRITARSKYGKSLMEHKIFEKKNIDKFKIIVLRNSSGDFNKTHFRDGSLHKLMIGNVDIDLLCYRPSVIYLNGVYWGILNIREKFSKFYLQENHGIDPRNIDLLEEDTTIIEGDFNDFLAMHTFVTTNDMSLKLNYDSAKSMIDIKSFCDYFIAETFLSNIDWPYNNMKYWKVREAGNKWRYLLMDLDISLGNNGWAPADLDLLGKILGPYGTANKHVQLFKSLLENTEFRNYFINRYADLVNTLFTSENMLANISEVKANLEADIPLHFQRWGNNMEGWNNEINYAVIPYIEARPAFALQFVQDTFHLVKEVDIGLNVWPPGAGQIKINTIQPSPLPWNGKYFDGVPVSITALPNQGFTFRQWQSDNINLADTYQASITMNVDTNNHFTAYFNSTSNNELLEIYPNPADDYVNVGFQLESAGKGTLSMYDSYGKQVKTKEEDFVAGPNFTGIETDQLANGFYIIHFINSEGDKVAKTAIVH